MSEQTPFRAALAASLEKRKRIDAEALLKDFDMLDLLQDMYYTGCLRGVDSMADALKRHREEEAKA